MFSHKLKKIGVTTLEKIPRAAYETLKPALRLMSLFITEPSMRRFFDHVANGEIVADDKGAYISKGAREGTPLGDEYIKAAFRFMRKNMYFVFGGKYGGGATATTSFAPRPDGQRGSAAMVTRTISAHGKTADEL
jgi:hypothetical protein